MSRHKPSLAEPSSRHRFAMRWLLALSLATALVAFGAAQAATPSSGTLSTITPSLTWTGAPIGGANVDETTCVEGTTCDTYTLTLAPGDYTGKRITVGMTWLIPANDFDLYVHAGTVSGPIVTQSAGGAPSTTERASIPIDPPVVVAPITYVVHVVAFTVTPGDIYAGDASLVATPLPRVATYLPGDLKFSHNFTLTAPVTVSDGEPSLRVDARGNCYVGGIRGVPAGVDLWRYDLNPASPTFDPDLRNPTYLGQPDAFAPGDSTGGADGGGDIDIAVSFPTNPSATPIVTIVSLAAADISSAVSTDRGEHFTLSPAVVPVPADDRQWIEADSTNRVYMLYRAPIPATGLFVTRSDDNGLNYLTTGVVSPSGTTPGYIDVDHTTGTVYVAHTSGSALFVGRSTDRGATWKNETVDNTTAHGSLFDVVKVGDDGTVYTVWSDEHDIYLAHSSDGGVTWSPKVRVNDRTTYKSNLLPWLEAGSAGRVAVVWYGSTSPTNDDGADWVALFSQTLNATATSPTFKQQVMSDHVIHGSNISLGGLTGAANRNLLDYFQVAFDPQGAAVIAYTDDHNDFDGNVYVTRQLDGPSFYATANGGTGMVNPVYPGALPGLDPSQPQVSDFLHDAVTGLLEPIVTDNPYDILWIKYSCDNSALAEPTLVATMKLSGLTTAPPGANWRMNFTANAPGGLSDRGDQFYVQASTTGGTPAFTFGTAVRISDGSLTYTSRGTADAGTIDSTLSTVTVKVRLSRLTPYLAHGPAVGTGSILYGLRGSAYTSGANGIRDNTRGGTAFIIPACNPLSVPEDAAGSGRMAFFRGLPTPNPGLGASTVHFDVARSGFVELSVFDVTGARVRTIQAGPMAPGAYARHWDGMTDHFRPAQSGMYFFVLNSADGVVSQRFSIVR